MVNSIQLGEVLLKKFNDVANEVLNRVYPIVGSVIPDPKFSELHSGYKSRKLLSNPDGSDRAYMSIIDDDTGMYFLYNLSDDKSVQTYFNTDGKIVKTLVNGKSVKRQADVHDIRSAEYVIQKISDIDLLIHRIDVEIPTSINRNGTRSYLPYIVANFEYFKNTDEFCVRLNLKEKVA